MLKRSKPEDMERSFTAPGIMEEKTVASRVNEISTQEKTIIGEHIAIEGSVRGEENLIVEGSIKGKIEMAKHDFTVGPKGRVDGEIRAQNVIISGELKGNISVQGKVQITAQADFYGEIKAKSISVEDGAYFKGAIELDREPHRKPAALQKPPDQKSPASAKEPVFQPDAAKKEK